METILTAVAGLILGTIILVFISFLSWGFGFILYHFSATKYFGFKLMAMSGLFTEFTFKHCPCRSHCSEVLCGLWNCPCYADDSKK